VSGRSLTNSKNSIGPSKDPWGTLEVTDSCSDVAPRTVTRCLWSCKYDLNQSCSEPAIPNWQSLSSNLAWSTLYSGPCQVLVAPFVSDIFKMAGLALASEDVHSFTVLWSGLFLTMFTHSDRVELLYCFVWNYRKPGNIYLLEVAMNLLLCGFRLFMFCWTQYHTDLKQMLKKNHQNICQNGHWKLETSLKVGLQPEGAHNHHSETVIN